MLRREWFGIKRLCKRVVRFVGPSLSVGLIVWCAGFASCFTIPSLFYCSSRFLRWAWYAIAAFLTSELLLHFYLTTTSTLRLGVVRKGDSDRGECCEVRLRREDGGDFVGTSDPLRRRSWWRQLRGAVEQCLRGTWALLRCGTCLSPPLPAQTTTATLQAIERHISNADAMTPEERRLLLLDAPRRYCEACQRWKAPREHHCAVCGVCVPKMDHHCVWIGTCVDVANHRFFVSLIVWVFIASATLSGLLLYGYGAAWDCRAGAGECEQAKCLARFGEDGPRLRSSLTRTTWLIAVYLSVISFLLLVWMVPGVVRNTTTIEYAVLSEKTALFASTAFLPANPYCRRWLDNVLEVYGRPHLMTDSSVPSAGLTRRLAARVLAVLLRSGGWVPPQEEVEQDAAMQPVNYATSRRFGVVCVWYVRVLLFLTWLLVVPVIGNVYDGVYYPTVTFRSSWTDFRPVKTSREALEGVI